MIEFAHNFIYQQSTFVHAAVFIGVVGTFVFFIWCITRIDR